MTGAQPWMTSVLLFLEIDRKVLFGACFIERQSDKREKSRRMYEISGAWVTGTDAWGETLFRRHSLISLDPRRGSVWVVAERV